MKNAIAVIDQELIDDAKSTIKPGDDACGRARISVGTLKDLILMCEDLIEINAELTKREQKYKVVLSMLMDEIESKEFCHNVTVTDAYDSSAELLKGDSDD